MLLLLLGYSYQRCTGKLTIRNASTRVDGEGDGKPITTNTPITCFDDEPGAAVLMRCEIRFSDEKKNEFKI